MTDRASTSRSSAPGRPARAAAILLARAGWSVALVERQAFPRRKVCGECVAASNLALLDALGIGAAFDARAGAAAASGRADARRRDDRRARCRRRRGQRIAGAGRSAASISTRCSLEPRERGRRDAAGSRGRCRRSTARAGGFALQRPAGIAARTTEVELRAGVVVAAHGSWEPLPFGARRRVAHARAARRPARVQGELPRRRARRRPAARARRSPAATAAWSSPTTASRRSPAASAPIGCRRLRVGDRPARVPATRSSRCCGANAAASRRRSTERRARARGSRPARFARASRVAGATTDSFASATRPARRTRSSAKGISMALQSAFVLAALIGPERRALLAPASALAAQRDAQLAPTRRSGAVGSRAASPSPPRFAHIAMRPALAAAAWPLVRRWPGILTARRAPRATRRAALRKRRAAAAA